MNKLLAALISGFVLATAVAGPASAETTKERWVKKKKADADREAERRGDDNNGTAGGARRSKSEAEKWRKQRHREIDDTAKQLGDGKRH